MVPETPLLQELLLYIHPPDKGESTRTFLPVPPTPLALLPWVNKCREKPGGMAAHALKPLSGPVSWDACSEDFAKQDSLGRDTEVGAWT